MWTGNGIIKPLKHMLWGVKLDGRFQGIQIIPFPFGHVDRKWNYETRNGIICIPLNLSSSLTPHNVFLAIWTGNLIIKPLRHTLWGVKLYGRFQGIQIIPFPACWQEMEFWKRNYLHSLEPVIEFDTPQCMSKRPNNYISCLPCGQETELLRLSDILCGVSKSIGSSKESE